MGGCLFEKLLKLFFPFANISAKADWNSIEKGYFFLHYVIFSQKWKYVVLSAEKKDAADRE
jgi:hypothetical protein